MGFLLKYGNISFVLQAILILIPYNAVGINISLGSTGWKDNRETATQEAKGSTITVGRTAAIIAKEDMTVKGSTVDAKDILLKAGNNIRILSSESKSTTIEDPKVKKE